MMSQIAKSATNSTLEVLCSKTFNVLINSMVGTTTFSIMTVSVTAPCKTTLEAEG
jgi:hypothetical protein